MRQLRNTLVVGSLLALLPALALAQGTIVSGRVTSDADAPLQGAAVSIPTLNVSASTNAEGRYSLTIPSANVGRTVTVVARRIGHAPGSAQVTLVAGTVTQDFRLPVSAAQLEGVVVTALGLEREKRSLGTSVQNISGTEVSTARETNIVNALSGKVAGVAITNAGSQGGSSRLVIRGANSIAGNNQPLFIVDGIPVSNQTVGAPGGYGGVDYGNAVQDLNPHDIESISVLMGPNAAALYGSRAANGAVVITTKRGKGVPRGFGVSVNSYVSFESPLKLPDYQNQYGQGSGGAFSYVDGAGGGTNDGTDESWGPKLDGQLICQFDSPRDAAGNCTPTPWVAHPNNVRNFFETGRTFTNNVALSAAGERSDVRLSLTSDELDGLAPGMQLKKFASALNGGAELGERWKATGSVQYIKNQGYNRNGTGYANDNFMQQFVWFGRQVDVQRLKDPRKDADGNMINWNHNYHDNPYWIQLESSNRDQRDRIIGVGSVKFQPTSWLTATLRSGSDWFREYRKVNRAYGLVESPFGGFDEDNIFTQETNTEGLLAATRPLTEGLSVTASLGGNLRSTQFKSNHVGVNELVVPGIYNVRNAQNDPTVLAYEERKQVNSLYGQAQFAYNDYLFVDVTGRNDWSSTLPADNNSYFYPSVSASFVFTDAVPALGTGLLNYGKIRAGLATVGNDAAPYQLQSTYTAGTPFGGAPRFSVPNALANSDLKPEETQSFEVGTELSFFDSRVGLDLTYYSKETSNQILNAQISGTTGYTSKAVNAGVISNKGIETLLSATPIKLANGFQWNTSLNFARNTSRVEELNADLQTVTLGSYWSLNVEARLNEPYGALFGNPYRRDSLGRITVDANGRPRPDGNKKVLGHYTPDWIGGFSNSFRYRGFDFSFLLDRHQGGEVFSVTNMFGRYAGVLQETLVGRDTGILIDAVYVNTCGKAADPATCGVKNTSRITAEQYNHWLYGIHEAAIFDASYTKLREMKLGYVIPSRLASKMGVSTAYVALVGRNLWLSSNVPHIDPETAFNNGNAQGFEHGQFPSQRSIGFTFSVTP
ncbi:MAG: SusC/RagA family TonB-linked outer membrane protein [Gemmatimonadaceae bacterium]